MCTLTAFMIAPHSADEAEPSSPAGEKGEERRVLRLAFNRDERRKRPTALPPRLQKGGNRISVFPVDPLSGGTWIAVNDTGLILSILNINREPGSPPPPLRSTIPRVSRGTIIPPLTEAPGVEEAVRLSHSLDPERFEPFRLVMTDLKEHAVLAWDGETLTQERSFWEDPIFFTSSGLGDGLVRQVRGELFEETLLNDARNAHRSPEERLRTLVRSQDLFHRHSWQGRPHVSVCMYRPDARTVSHTLVEVSGERIRMSYYPEPPNRDASPIIREPRLD